VVNELKGGGDAIEAVAALKRRGRDVELQLIGKGDVDIFSRRARAAGVADCVHFEGLQPNSRVIEAMRSSDLVLVPSHHLYPEGLPCVFYEGFATRTPVICSNHPMFRGIISEEAAVLLPEKRPDAYADAMEKVLDDPGLYRRMSVAIKDAWHQFQCPVRWDEMIDQWLGATPRTIAGWRSILWRLEGIPGEGTSGSDRLGRVGTFPVPVATQAVAPLDRPRNRGIIPVMSCRTRSRSRRDQDQCPASCRFARDFACESDTEVSGHRVA